MGVKRPEDEGDVEHPRLSRTSAAFMIGTGGYWSPEEGEVCSGCKAREDFVEEETAK